VSETSPAGRIDVVLAELVASVLRVEEKLDRALDPDRVRLEILLPAIVAVVGEMRFCLGDLEGEVDFGGLTIAQVGLLLKRNRHRAIAGYRITVHGKRNSAREWSCTLVEPSS
jgi:hypothetical protein